MVALLVDERAAKGWATVFADRRQLLRGLASVWEGIEPAGMDGGHLRGAFADGLEEAATLLDEPALAAEAPRWRDLAGRWHALAETALPDDIPEIAHLRTLTATVTGPVAEGQDAVHGRRSHGVPATPPSSADDPRADYGGEHGQDQARAAGS